MNVLIWFVTLILISLYYTILYIPYLVICTILYYIILCYCVLYYTIPIYLYYIILYYIILYYTILYDTMLYDLSIYPSISYMVSQHLHCWHMTVLLGLKRAAGTELSAPVTAKPSPIVDEMQRSLENTSCQSWKLIFQDYYSWEQMHRNAWVCAELGNPDLRVFVGGKNSIKNLLRVFPRN